MDPIKQLIQRMPSRLNRSSSIKKNTQVFFFEESGGAKVPTVIIKLNKQNVKRVQQREREKKAELGRGCRQGRKSKRHKKKQRKSKENRLSILDFESMKKVSSCPALTLYWRSLSSLKKTHLLLDKSILIPLKMSSFLAVQMDQHNKIMASMKNWKFSWMFICEANSGKPLSKGGINVYRIPAYPCKWTISKKMVN
jgi:hypothetical protein